MTIEFGPPRTYSDAILRIPNTLDPLYGRDKATTDCANLRTWMTNNIPNPKLFETTKLGARSYDLSREAISLLHQANSFKRSIASGFSSEYQWSRLEDYRWSSAFPLGDDNYRWWQFTKFEPYFINLQYSLYCVELNKQHEDHKSYTRFDEKSEFVMLMATQEEIKALHQELSENDSFRVPLLRPQSLLIL